MTPRPSCTVAIDRVVLRGLAVARGDAPALRALLARAVAQRLAVQAPPNASLGGARLRFAAPAPPGNGGAAVAADLIAQGIARALRERSAPRG
jgi:hypothetical protein